MKTKILFLLLVFFTQNTFSQTVSYVGFIGDELIELVLHNHNYKGYDYDYIRALYMFDRFDDTKRIDGRFRKKDKTLELYDIDFVPNGDTLKVLRFENFHKDSIEVLGKYTDLKTQEILPIRLFRNFQLCGYEDCEEQTIIVKGSTQKHYFRLMIESSKDFGSSVSAVKVYEKGTDKLLQRIDLKYSCDFRNLLDDIWVDDYNFDGYEDFAILEHQHIGTNFFHLHILFNPYTEQYFVSNIRGSDLTFTKTEEKVIITSHFYTDAREYSDTYELKNNKMIFVEGWHIYHDSGEKECYIWNEKTQEAEKCECE